jgi:hypothetical protein
MELLSSIRVQRKAGATTYTTFTPTLRYEATERHGRVVNTPASHSGGPV